MDQFLIQKAGSKSSILAEKNKELTEQFEQANLSIFGNERFRFRQIDIVHAIMRGEDVFVIMPTGGGKSLCYALPAVLSQGVTVVISPLISLIEDQVSALLRLPSGGVPAAYLTSACTEAQLKSVDEDLKRAYDGNEPFLKLLYVTPEKMVKSRETRNLLKALYNNEMLARFVIDECHCVSSWGHDFRKDYGELNILKEDYPQAPIVALTATARTKVAEDTLKILKIQNCTKFSLGYDRDNLLFEVRVKPSSKADTYKLILNYILTYPKDTTGIIYCFSRNDCEETAAFLTNNNVSADFYHAKQTKGDKKMVQSSWLKGEVKVVCATIAYGMGIDKPDVRYVIHMSMAKSIEGYYQEAGRAGRDGKRSECVVYYKAADVSSLARLMAKPPSRKLSKKDRDMLEEMQEYCETRTDCRRKHFHDKFGSGGVFKRCGNMCDNCLVANGQPRRGDDTAAAREEIDEEYSCSISRNADKNDQKNKATKNKNTKIDDDIEIYGNDPEFVISKKPLFQKASALKTSMISEKANVAKSKPTLKQPTGVKNYFSNSGNLDDSSDNVENNFFVNHRNDTVKNDNNDNNNNNNNNNNNKLQYTKRRENFTGVIENDNYNSHNNIVDDNDEWLDGGNEVLL